MNINKRDTFILWILIWGLLGLLWMWILNYVQDHMEIKISKCGQECKIDYLYDLFQENEKDIDICKI